jgi:hypothetical protein
MRVSTQLEQILGELLAECVIRVLADQRVVIYVDLELFLLLKFLKNLNFEN